MDTLDIKQISFFPLQTILLRWHFFVLANWTLELTDKSSTLFLSLTLLMNLSSGKLASGGSDLKLDFLKSVASGGSKMASGGQVWGSIFTHFWTLSKMTSKSWPLGENLQFCDFQPKNYTTKLASHSGSQEKKNRRNRLALTPPN